MSVAAVGYCDQCSAVVNGHWPSCLVCHAPITALSHETGSPTSAMPTHPQVEAVTEVASPTLPVQPGWLVAYRDRQWVLCGGCDDRQHGTVQECRWKMGGWTVHLTDRQQLPLTSIRSVGKTDSEGKLVAAWSVREHGHDGMRQERSPVVGAAIPAERTYEEALPVTRAAKGRFEKQLVYVTRSLSIMRQEMSRSRARQLPNQVKSWREI